MSSITDFYADGALNIARPPKEVLVERFNHINGLQLDANGFQLALPVIEAGTNYNTTIWLMPAASSSWTTGVKIYYTRVQLAEQMQHTAEVKTNGATNLYEILDAVNAAYGLYLTEGDVLDATIHYSISGDTTSNGTVTIQVRTTSIFFLGQLTIPVNNSVQHGIGTYEEEMLHFMALRPIDSAGITDTIKAYNELGDLETNFNFMSNVVLSKSTIKHMWKRPNGTLIVLGDFAYTFTNELGETSSFARKVIVLDRTGKASSASAGNLFGVDYTQVTHVPDLINERVYVIDRGNEIGGNVHGLHAYNAQGAYDSTFLPALSTKVQAVAPYQDMLYVVTQSSNNAPVLRRLLSNGSVDDTFTPVLVTPAGLRDGIDVARVTSAHASEAGISLVYYVDAVPNSGAPAWAIYSRTQQSTGVGTPVQYYDHSGVHNASVGKAFKLQTSNRLGLGTATSALAGNDQSIVYSAQLINPTTGREGMGVGAVQLDGSISSACTQAVSEHYPAFSDVVAIQTMTRGDIMVAANVQLEDSVGTQEAAGVFFFSYDGYFATQEVVLPNYKLLAASSHHFM